MCLCNNVLFLNIGFLIFDWYDGELLLYLLNNLFYNILISCVMRLSYYFCIFVRM